MSALTWALSAFAGVSGIVYLLLMRKAINAEAAADIYLRELMAARALLYENGLDHEPDAHEAIPALSMEAKSRPKPAWWHNPPALSVMRPPRGGTGVRPLGEGWHWTNVNGGRWIRPPKGGTGVNRAPVRPPRPPV